MQSCRTPQITARNYVETVLPTNSQLAIININSRQPTTLVLTSRRLFVCAYFQPLSSSLVVALVPLFDVFLVL